MRTSKEASKPSDAVREAVGLRKSLRRIPRPIAMGCFVLFLLVVAAYALTLRNRWQEEVDLNSGERILVSRTESWKITFDLGASFPLTFKPDPWTRRIDFAYRGKSYSYRGNAVIQLLAIRSDGLPILVAIPDLASWNWGPDGKRRIDDCLVPYYV